MSSNLTYILRGLLYRDNRASKWIDILSNHEDVFAKFDIRPPKIIVGLSVTLPAERKFLQGVWTFPAALDTGLNRTLEIDERHLEKWAGTRKSYLRIIKTNQQSDNGRYDECAVNIWLHRSPYTNPKSDRYDKPLHLENSGSIRVMHPLADRLKPRLPILGLQALIDTDLDLKVETRRGVFVIWRSKTFPFLRVLEGFRS